MFLTQNAREGKRGKERSSEGERERGNAKQKIQYQRRETAKSPLTMSFNAGFHHCLCGLAFGQP